MKNHKINQSEFSFNQTGGSFQSKLIFAARRKRDKYQRR